MTKIQGYKIPNVVNPPAWPPKYADLGQLLWYG